MTLLADDPVVGLWLGRMLVTMGAAARQHVLAGFTVDGAAHATVRAVRQLCAHRAHSDDAR